MNKALVLLSGGQDSTTCLYWALENFSYVEAVGFDYGQRHSLELKFAKKTALIANVNFEIISINNLFKNSALINKTLLFFKASFCLLIIRSAAGIPVP